MQRIHELLDPWTRKDPDRVAIIETEGLSVDYKGFSQAVDEASSVLRDYGVRGGDRVQIVAENCLALLSFLFAASRLNAWAIPVNARMSATELAHIKAHAEPRAMVFTHCVTEAAARHAQRYDATLHDGYSFGTVMIAGPFACDPEPTAEAGDEQVAALIYTTGTTGNPKGVMLTHANLLYASKVSVDVRKLNVRDHIVGVLPITHIFAFSSAFLAAVRAGALVELQPRFEPEKVFLALRNGATAMPAVPAIYPLC